MAKSVTAGEIQKARLLALILPEVERREIERRYGVRPALLSAVVGFFEFWLGVAVFAFGHPGIGGGIGLILWFANPVAWLGLLIMVTALLRVASYLANHDSFGEPLVWLFLRLYQFNKGAADARHVREEYGPVRPDRIVRDDNDALVLLASREKPDWDEYATVRVEDGFFRIVGTEQRREGPYTAIAYMLEAQPESENFLGLVHTDARLPPPRHLAPGPSESDT